VTLSRNDCYVLLIFRFYDEFSSEIFDLTVIFVFLKALLLDNYVLYLLRTYILSSATGL